MNKIKVGQNIWHITAVGETAPGREWLLENYAKQIMQEYDEEHHEKPVLLTDPIVRDADSDADKRFARTVQNARKSSLQHKRLPLPEAIVKQIERPLTRPKKPAQQKPSQSNTTRRLRKHKKIQ